MSPEPRLPHLARLLLRLAPASGEARADAEADVHELFVQRRRERGAAYAHWRLYHDVASLWSQRHPGPAEALPSLRPVVLLRDAGSDLRYAVRLFARQPAILLLTIVGLALGLGIATIAFSVLNAAVLRGEGVKDPGRAPGVLRVSGGSTTPVWSYDEFLRLREGSNRMQVETVFTDAASIGTTGVDIDVQSVPLAFVSGGFFAATGGRPALGRTLESADERQVGTAPAVVSHVFWKSRFQADPNIVGRTIRVGRTMATIVGVAERGFSVPANRLLWMPITAYGAVYDAAQASPFPGLGVQVFGRLQPGVTLAEAEAQLNGVASTLPRTAKISSALQARLDPHAGLGRMNGSDTLIITILVCVAIGLVLVLAGANVASVLISTAITREREMGVRSALGASRGRIVRQLVTEGLALGTAAAALGLVFTSWTMPIIRTMIEAPAGADLAPDRNVFIFLGMVTILTSVGAGLAPAWHGRGVDLVTPLKGDGARENRAAPRRLRSMLVMTQAAVSVVLIIVASLFVRATFRAAAIDVGFDPAGLYAVSPGLGRTAYENDGAGIKSFWARAVPDVTSIPGVSAATLVEVTPFGDLTKTSVTRDRPARIVNLNRTRAAYFETLGIRVLAGRTYTRDEVAAGIPVAVISESVARAYWPQSSPVGQLLPEAIPLSTTRPVVIGVVADAITNDLHERNALTIYEPLDPPNEVFAQLLMRVSPGALDEARQRLRAIDPQANLRIVSVDARMQQEAGRPRMLAMLTGFVGVIAIVLCVIGLYGLTASVVGQRTREMGVRLALGADRGDLLTLLIRDSLKPVIAGLAIGAGAAVLASRVVASAMFFGVSPQDPIAFTGSAVILLVAAIAAVIVPTRRAASVDPAFVLRGA